MTYSGRLTESSGAPKDGPVAIEATFWTAEIDGTQLGQTFEFASVILNQGVFSLYFPFMASQVQDIFRDGTEPVFIEISSGGKAYPRQKFNYIPLAMRIPVDNKTLSFDAASGQLGIKNAKTATSGSVLVSDGAGGVKWDNLSSSNLTAKTQAGSDPSADQVLTYKGGKWVAASLPASSPTGNYLTELVGDVVATGPGSGTATLAVVAIPGTATKVTFDAKGRVTSGASLSTADIPPLSAALIVSGTLGAANGGTGVSSTATFPTSGVVATRDATETLSNKTLSGATINGSSSIGGSTTIDTTGTATTGALTASTVTSQGSVTVQGNGTNASKLVLNDKANTNYVAFKAPDTLASQMTWELPGTNGTAGQVLSTNGTGTLSWVSGVAPTGTASGDLSGNFPGPTVATVGGKTSTAIATSVNDTVAATSAGTASTIVKRDASGNFTAGTITGTLSGNATNVTGTVAIANGGTGATTASAAFDALSPLTTIGDILYAGAGGADTRLAGNQSSAKQFLSSTGTGSAANAPVWAALTAIDIPAHSASLITSGVLGVANGGTGAATTTANYVFAGPTTGTGAPTFRTLVAGDLPAMGGANGTAAGTAGAVPGPTATDNVKFLRGDGTWATPTAAAAGSANQIQYNSGGLLTGNANFVYSGGNVGIGTTAPSTPLTVAGTVQSTSGGFKFPDGTLQVSAAPVTGLVTLTDASTITVNGSLGAVYKVTLGGNRTLANPTNLVPGAVYTFLFTQDATGGRTLTFGNNYVFPGAISNPALSAASGATDSAQFVSDGTNLYYISGFASAAAPCLAPTNLAVTITISSTSGTTNLTWANPGVNHQNNIIQRSADGVTNWTSMATVSAGTISTSYADSDLATQSYYWRVTANCGLSGTNSSLAKKGVSSIPGPNSVTRTPIDSTSATISWTAASGATGYEVSRSIVGSDTWSVIATPGSGTTTYTDSNLALNVAYSYRVRAVQGSNYSNFYSATTACGAAAQFTCGETGNSCYSNVNAVLGASAVTPAGRCLIMVYANGASGFTVWKDQYSTNILSANGLDSWSMALIPSGKGQSTTPFSDPNLGTASTVLEGRACPTNVYISDTKMLSTDNCLYYTPAYATQLLNAGGSDNGAQLGISSWSATAWYVGNIATCSSKNMRLPTLYEGAVRDPGSTNANKPNHTPTFNAVTGVPSAAGWTWTSSSYTYNPVNGTLATTIFWTWSGSSSAGSNSYAGGTGSNYVRCVLP